MATNEGKTSHFVIRLAHMTLALVFILSALGKAFSPSSFLSVHNTISFFSFIDATTALYGSIVLEALVAFLLLVERTAPLGSLAAFGSLLVFSGVLMYARTLA